MMGSYEENSSVLPETPNQTPPDSVSGLNSNTFLSNLYSASEKQKEILVGDLKNLILEHNGYEEKNNNNRNENLQVDWQSGCNSQYPLRPHAENCTFYLKSGHCKFGYYCKFNHPLRRSFQDKENHQGLTVKDKRQIECKYYRASGGCMYGNSCRYRHSNEDYVLTPLEVNSLAMPIQVGINEKREKDGFSEQTEQIECKYYLSPGGCNYGKACRYRHSKGKSRYLENFELLPEELNFLGLPIRRLEKECPYYMRTGSCAYGSSCRFNHPDPTAAEESSTFGSDPSGFGDHSQGYYNGSSLSSNKMSDEHLTYLNHNSPFANGMHANSEWNRHQETTNPYLAPSIDKEIQTADISKLHQEQIEVDEFPERPGEPECPHFMKTGYCKFKSVCKFHHPKSILNNAGLPLRPDRRICLNYEKSGFCKYGVSCYFHHPKN